MALPDGRFGAIAGKKSLTDAHPPHGAFISDQLFEFASVAAEPGR
jgi:hypothetical protein